MAKPRRLHGAKQRAHRTCPESSAQVCATPHSRDGVEPPPDLLQDIPGSLVSFLSRGCALGAGGQPGHARQQKVKEFTSGALETFGACVVFI